MKTQKNIHIIYSLSPEIYTIVALFSNLMAQNTEQSEIDPI